MALFSSKTIEQMRESVARYVPGNRLFVSKNLAMNNLYMFLEGIAVEAQRANDLLIDYNEEFYPDTTTNFLQEWENVVGIPDDCLIVTDNDFIERRRNILTKLVDMAGQSAQDFQDIALAFGVTSEILGGDDPAVVPPIMPPEDRPFTIVVRFEDAFVFPYTFPLAFGSAPTAILACLYLKMRPADCQVVFQAI